MDSIIRDKLRDIFNKHDQVGIYFGKGINYDEYDQEINGLIIRFKRSKNLEEFTSEIHTLFINMFDKEIAGQKLKYKKLAKEVYDYLNKVLEY